MKTANKKITRLTAALLALVLALSLAACGTKTPAETEAPAAGKHFTFTVVDDKGESTYFTLTSEEETVGAALAHRGRGESVRALCQDRERTHRRL